MKKRNKPPPSRLINPASGLTQLLETNRISLYKRRNRALTRQTESLPKQQTSKLRLAIAASLTLIISQQRAEALAIDKAHQRKGHAGKAAAHATALGQGLLASGADLLDWLSNINDVVNPLWRLKRRIDAALLTYEECTGASNSCLTATTRASYLKRVELADHRELVEALGFDPANIDLDAFSQAWHSAWVLTGDKQVVAMITDFAKDYIDAQHALEYSQAAGGAAFEVLLALLLTATTAGTGVAANMASKARHVGEFGRVGRKLILLADALENSPRGIVRRQGKTTKVVEGNRGGGRNIEQAKKKVESKSTEPELKSVTDDPGNKAEGVLRKLPESNYSTIKGRSVHNVNADTLILGKYTPTVTNGVPDWSTPGQDSYVAIAKTEKATYFDLGGEWEDVTSKYDLSDDEMFKLFNIPVLNDAVNGGKQIKFTHDPRTNGGFLQQEWEYLQNKHGYNRLKEIDGAWYAK